MKLISEDMLHMCMLSATLSSIRHCRDANLQEFCKSLIDLYATAKGDTLVGNVFQYFSLLHLFLLESYWICEESSGNDKIQ